MMTWQKTHRDCLLAVILVLGTMAAYLPVRHAGFIWDDNVILLNNPLILRADGWYQAWFNRAAQDFVPVTITSFWLEWRLWGASPLGYHLDNVLLHVCNALLLWRILLHLKIPGAWLAAALFAVHPVNVESVACIAQRKNTLTMLLFLATVQFYLTFEDSGRRRWFWLAAGMFLLALMGKTAVVPLPFVLLGLAWWRRGQIDGKDVRPSMVFFALAAAGSLMAVWIQRGAAIGTVVRVDSFWGRLAGAGWALWFYLGKALLPLRLSFVYPRWEIPAGNPLSYVPLILWVMGLWVCWRYRKGWGKGAFFALGYFSVMLLPVLGFVNISFMRYSLVSDHWQYFAIIGPMALAATAIRRPLVAATLLLVLGGLTWKQCGMYTNAETLWQTTLRLNPDCWLAHNSLGHVFIEEGKVDEGVAQLRQALQIKTDDEDSHLNLGIVDMEKGRMDEAIAHFQKAVQINPNFAQAHNNLGIVLMQRGKADEAITHFQKALQLKPEVAEWRYNFGEALMRKGRVDEAVAQYQEALQLKPDMAQAHVNLGNALLQKGNVVEAIAHFQQALRIEPAQPVVENNLAWLLAACSKASVRNGKAAVELASQANELTGGKNPTILHTLAAAYAEAGRFSDAVETAQRALRLAEAQNDPGLVGALQSELILYQAGKPFHNHGPTQ